MKTIELSKIQSPQYENNIENYGDFSDTCICCGKRTKGKLLIQMTTTGLLTDCPEEVEDTQGWFCIGPDCMKKFEQTAK